MKRSAHLSSFYWFGTLLFVLGAAFPAYWVLRAQTDGVISGYNRYGPSHTYERQTEPEAFARAVRLWSAVAVLDGIFGIACVWRALTVASSRRADARGLS